MDHPVLQPARERMERLAEEPGQYHAEWNALHYLLGGDESLGRQAIAETIDTMRAQTWPGHDDHHAGNVSRPIGRMMVSAAVVYDWCYPLLTPEDMEAIRSEMVRYAELLECGYPPARQGAVTGHSSEHMMIRDMIAAGIALYDEFSEMYDLSASRFFSEHLPARNWFYPGHAYHQGESYGTYRYGADIYPTWIFDRLGFGNVYHPSQQFVPYQWIYMRRPDGQFLRQGDTYKHSAPKGQPWGTGDGGVLSTSYYGDGCVLADWLHNTNIHTGGDNSLFDLLWRDPDLKPRPCTDLPLSRYMGFPFGWMIARTGWDEACVIAEMRVNVYNFTNHYHLDAGSFQIYHKGPLAIDSGLYQGTDGGYGSPHNQNY
jgi:heparin/heparan-sulfate lyase